MPCALRDDPIPLWTLALTFCFSGVLPLFPARRRFCYFFCRGLRFRSLHRFSGLSPWLSASFHCAPARRLCIHPLPLPPCFFFQRFLLPVASAAGPFSPQIPLLAAASVISFAATSGPSFSAVPPARRRGCRPVFAFGRGSCARPPVGRVAKKPSNRRKRGKDGVVAEKSTGSELYFAS